MPRGQRFPLEVMLRAMREVDNGVPVSVVCRKVGMVEKTFYRYREKYAGMEASEARRLRELEDENARLKKRLSEQMLHNEALRDVLSKDGEARAAPPGGVSRAGRVRAQRAQRLPCAGGGAGLATVFLDEKSSGRDHRPDADTRGEPAPCGLPNTRATPSPRGPPNQPEACLSHLPGRGAVDLRQAAAAVGRFAPAVIAAVTKPGERWAMDFVFDRTSDGHRFRILTLIDTFTRRSPGAIIERSIRRTSRRALPRPDRRYARIPQSHHRRQRTRVHLQRA
jgi:putative transposase